MFILVDCGEEVGIWVIVGVGNGNGVDGCGVAVADAVPIEALGESWGDTDWMTVGDGDTVGERDGTGDMVGDTIGDIGE